MEQGYFITGTDTNAGKTWASVAMMRYIKAKGKSVIGLKPVASGCFVKDSKLYNDDALLLQANASVKLDYDLVNPYAFELSVSPHIAGKDHPVEFQVIRDVFDQVKDQAQVIIVEGAGGWHSPLNDYQDNSHLARELELPVIMTVAIKLGCINHAKLTFDAITKSGLSCAGWIAVYIDSSQLCPEMIVMSLKERLDVPLLGELPYLEVADFNKLAECLYIRRI
jgi:dethiobiotin synthetase